MEFVQNEILSRPVALLRNGGIIVADRLVIDEKDCTPNFYDGLFIQRDENQTLQLSYEAIMSYQMDEFQFILILGAENF